MHAPVLFSVKQASVASNCGLLNKMPLIWALDNPADQLEELFMSLSQYWVYSEHKNERQLAFGMTCSDKAFPKAFCP